MCWKKRVNCQWPISDESVSLETVFQPAMATRVLRAICKAQNRQAYIKLKKAKMWKKIALLVVHLLFAMREGVVDLPAKGTAITKSIPSPYSITYVVYPRPSVKRTFSRFIFFQRYMTSLRIMGRDRKYRVGSKFTYFNDVTINPIKKWLIFCISKKFEIDPIFFTYIQVLNHTVPLPRRPDKYMKKVWGSGWPKYVGKRVQAQGTFDIAFQGLITLDWLSW